MRASLSHGPHAAVYNNRAGLVDSISASLGVWSDVESECQL